MRVCAKAGARAKEPSDFVFVAACKSDVAEVAVSVARVATAYG